MSAQFILVGILILAISGAGYLLRGAYEHIGLLKAENDSLEENVTAYLNSIKKVRTERDQLDSLYLQYKQENRRVYKNLEEQLHAIRNTSADDCANAIVTSDRISILQQPVWESMPRSNTATANTGGDDT